MAAIGWHRKGSDILYSGSTGGVSLGEFNSTAANYGMKVSPTRTKVFSVYVDDGGAALTPSGSVSDLRGLISRFLITANQSAVHARAWGLMGQAKVYNALWSEEQIGGVNGRLEIVQAGAGTTTLGGYGVSSGVCGIAATAGTTTVSANHVFAAVAAIADIKGTCTQTGIVCGLYVGKYDTSQWSDGTSRADFTYGAYIATGTTGLYISTTPTTAIDARGLVTVAQTITSATPATTRLIRSELTVTPATSVAVGSNGSLAAVRGAVTLTTAKSITDGYLYGVQGKAVLDGATVAVGTDHIAGVYAQMSANGTTVTNGHVAIMIASGQNLPTSSNVDAIYCESGNGKINSVIKANVKCDYFLDISNFESGGCCSSSVDVSTSSSSGNIKVLVDGQVRYLKLYSS